MARHFDPNILAVKNKAYYWHKYVVEDADFISKASSLKDEIDSNFDRSKLFSYDPDLLLDDGLPPHLITEFNDLAAEYRISRTFLTRYLDGSYGNLKALQSAFAVRVSCSYKDGQIILKMGENITQEQFRQLWPMVELASTQSTTIINKKRDIKANMHLVYCIQRALDSGYDFKKIAALYNQNELTGYDSTNYDAYTSSELKTYYKRHRFFE